MSADSKVAAARALLTGVHWEQWRSNAIGEEQRNEMIVAAIEKAEWLDFSILYDGDALVVVDVTEDGMRIEVFECYLRRIGVVRRDDPEPEEIPE